jgi:hypothetical protein
VKLPQPLPQAPQRGMVQLRNAPLSQPHAGGDVVEGLLLEVVPKDDPALGLGQLLAQLGQLAAQLGQLDAATSVIGLKDVIE